MDSEAEVEKNAEAECCGSVAAEVDAEVVAKAEPEEEGGSGEWRRWSRASERVV